MPLYSTLASSVPSAADHSLAGWSFDSAQAQGGTVLGAGGTLYLSKCKVTSPLITNIIMHVATAGTTLTAGQCFAALFSAAGALLSTTADQAAGWQSTGVKTMALSVAQTVPLGNVYVGVFANGSVLPAFSRSGGIAAGLSNVGLSAPNFRFATADTALTTAMPANLGTQTSFPTAWWVGLS